MSQASERIAECRGALFFSHINMHGGEQFSLWHRRATNEVMFSDTHAGRTEKPREGDGWMPSTVNLPQRVSPRPGCEDGIVRTIDQFMAIFHEDARVLC